MVETISVIDEASEYVDAMLVSATGVGDAVQLAVRRYAALSSDKLGREVPSKKISEDPVEDIVVGVIEITPKVLLHIQNGPASK